MIVDFSVLVFTMGLGKFMQVNLWFHGCFLYAHKLKLMRYDTKQLKILTQAQ